MPEIPSGIIGSPYSPTWFNIRDICTRDLNPNSWQSFPSGHTGSSFAAGTFLALYLNAKLKAFSNYQTSFWKSICVLAPLFGAGLISTGMIIDCVSLYPVPFDALSDPAPTSSRSEASDLRADLLTSKLRIIMLTTSS